MTLSIIEALRSGHSPNVGTSAIAERRSASVPVTGRGAGAQGAVPDIAELYRSQFDFVWRTARRLGVPPLHLDDIVQEVFVTVHRRLDSFEGRSHTRTWLYGITRRVVSNHRRAWSRREEREQAAAELETARAADARAPHERLEGARLLHALLLGLDEEKREVFVLYELEQMPAREIADALQIGQSCVYGRLRAARQAFELSLRRHRAREGGEP